MNSKFITLYHAFKGFILISSASSSQTLFLTLKYSFHELKALKYYKLIQRCFEQ